MPAFGKPTSAASARSFSRSSSHSSSPGKPVSANRGACRVGVAKRLLPRPAKPAARDDRARSGMREVGEQPSLVVEHLCADGDVELGVGARGTVLQRTAAASAAAGLDVLIRAKRRQIAEVVIRDEHDVAARAAVAAVRPSLGNVLLPAKGEAAVAAAARLHVDSDAVVEHQRDSRDASD